MFEICQLKVLWQTSLTIITKTISVLSHKRNEVGIVASRISTWISNSLIDIIAATKKIMKIQNQKESKRPTNVNIVDAKILTEGGFKAVISAQQEISFEKNLLKCIRYLFWIDTNTFLIIYAKKTKKSSKLSGSRQSILLWMVTCFNVPTPEMIAFYKF